MSMELKIIDPTSLSQEDRAELDANIESLIAGYKNNRQEINRLVFESVSAMTTGEEYERQLASKKGLRRLIGGITGSNKALQDKINSNRAMAQYAAQQTLQRLAEQNLMSFDLITAVNNKLNASVVAIEGEINEVYATLAAFFKQSRSDVIQFEHRVERLERNVNLLNWQNSIEYQMFDGVEYADLDDTTKIVCLVRDFYDITKGNWTTSDLLLLKTAMGTIGISPRANIGLFDFIRFVDENSHLRRHLLGGLQISRMPEAYLVPLCGMKKLELLSGEERYVVETVTDELRQQGIRMDEALVREELAKKYVCQEATVDIGMTINSYDLILEMLFNLRAAYDGGLLVAENVESTVDDGTDEENLDELYQTTSLLFKDCKLEEAYPLLLDLSARGYARANALLYWLQSDGCKSSPCNTQIAKEYAKRGYQAGDTICALQYALFCCESKDERIKLYQKYIPHLRKLADSGDVFAEYMMGICRLNETDEPADYFEALQWFLEASSKNFYRAFYGIALRYYRGEGIAKSIDTAQLWLFKATEFKEYATAYNLLGDIYVEEFQEYSEGYNLYMHAATLENGEAYKNLGVMYNMGWGVAQDLNEAESHYKMAAELGNPDGQYYLGKLYLEVQGHPQDLKIAKYWINLAANQGHSEAIKLLKERFSN